MALEGRATVAAVPAHASVAIRRAKAEDTRVVVRIYIDSWNGGFGHLLGRRVVDHALVGRWERDLVAPPPSHWWVAERGGAIVGVAGVGASRDPMDPALGELDTLHVAPDSFRTGVGRALMEVALGQLNRDGYAEAVLWTVNHYPRGQRFYEAMGWRRDGRTRDDGRQLMYRHPLG